MADKTKIMLLMNPRGTATCHVKPYIMSFCSVLIRDRHRVSFNQLVGIDSGSGSGLDIVGSSVTHTVLLV